MDGEIIGNSYKYIIDESYGINKDGFIAIGTESIVYKGLKPRMTALCSFRVCLNSNRKLKLLMAKKLTA